jgi:adenosylmethionine-8-amino-7-oxononanoate aminotransferase
MRVNVSSHDLKVLDHKHHLHPFTEHGALGVDERRVITRADGVWLWDPTATAISTAWPASGASMSVTAGRKSAKPSARR